MHVRHCTAGRTQELYGWVVGSRAAMHQPRPLPCATRVLRSLYELDADDAALFADESPVDGCIATGGM